MKENPEKEEGKRKRFASFSWVSYEADRAGSDVADVPL